MLGVVSVSGCMSEHTRLLAALVFIPLVLTMCLCGERDGPGRHGKFGKAARTSATAQRSNHDQSALSVHSAQSLDSYHACQCASFSREEAARQAWLYICIAQCGNLSRFCSLRMSVQTQRGNKSTRGHLHKMCIAHAHSDRSGTTQEPDIRIHRRPGHAGCRCRCL